MIKNPSAIQEIWVRSLGQEDPLEKGMSTYSSILAWRTPLMEEAGGLQSMGSQDLDMTERITLSGKSDQVRKGIPPPVTTCLRNLLNGKSTRVREKLWLRVIVVQFYGDSYDFHQASVTHLQSRSKGLSLDRITEKSKSDDAYENTWEMESGFKSDHIIEEILHWHSYLAALTTSNTFLK